MACDLCFRLGLLLVSAFLPFSAVVKDLFRDLVCALRPLTYPIKNVSINFVYCIEIVYRVCFFIVQSFAYILSILLGFVDGL